jgi:hypothetical protein
MTRRNERTGLTRNRGNTISVAENILRKYLQREYCNMSNAAGATTL